jgi:hypothetical protein
MATRRTRMSFTLLVLIGLGVLSACGTADKADVLDGTPPSTITDRSFKRPFRPDAATARLRWRPLLAHAASGCPSTR